MLKGGAFAHWPNALVRMTGCRCPSIWSLRCDHVSSTFNLRRPIPTIDKLPFTVKFTPDTTKTGPDAPVPALLTRVSVPTHIDRTRCSLRLCRVRSSPVSIQRGKSTTGLVRSHMTERRPEFGPLWPTPSPGFSVRHLWPDAGPARPIHFFFSVRRQTLAALLLLLLTRRPPKVRPQCPVKGKQPLDFTNFSTLAQIC
jgi:hypothetical protein